MTDEERAAVEFTVQAQALAIDQAIDAFTDEQKITFLQRLKTHYDNSLADMGG